MSLYPDFLQKNLRFIELNCTLFTIPKPDRVKKDEAFRTALEGEPVFSIGFGVDDRHLFMLVGFALSVDHDPDLAQLIFDHHIDPFV